MPEGVVRGDPRSLRFGPQRLTVDGVDAEAADMPGFGRMAAVSGVVSIDTAWVPVA